MGRHGGINILHQKSWHVWRLDNRLTVERDELRHNAEGREECRAQERATFSAKLATLRRRAVGDEEKEEEEVPGQAPLPDAGTMAAPPSCSSQTPRGRGRATNSYRFGQVTVSNLKQAEQHLDASLKRHGGNEATMGMAKRQRGERMAVAASYWGSEDLGSGPHLNLFERAERESRHHAAEHERQVGHTQRNNELFQKSKKRPLSEFDEIAAEVPWYTRTRSVRGLLPSELRGKGAEPKKHGPLTSGGTNGANRRASPRGVPLQSDKGSGRKTEKREGRTKREKTESKEGKKERKRQEFMALRREREEREEQERARALRLFGSPA